jgi:hypothetical protein
MAAVITGPGEVEQAQGELPLTPVQILDRAIDVLIERGWCQGHGADERGRYCIHGALAIRGRSRGCEQPGARERETRAVSSAVRPGLRACRASPAA